MGIYLRIKPGLRRHLQVRAAGTETNPHYVGPSGSFSLGTWDPGPGTASPKQSLKAFGRWFYLQSTLSQIYF